MPAALHGSGLLPVGSFAYSFQHVSGPDLATLLGILDTGECYTMSSVHKLTGKPNWICFYTGHEGRRRCKSTVTISKQVAERLGNAIQKIENKK